MAGGIGGSAEGAPDTAAAVLPGARGIHRILAQARFLVAVVLVTVAVALWLKAGLAMPPGSISDGPFSLFLAMVGALTWSTIGLVLSIRRPEVRIGRLAAWMGILTAALTSAWAYLALVDRPGASPGDAAPYVGLLAAVIATPAVVSFNILISLLFPTDRLHAKRWNWVAWLTLAGSLLAAIGRLLRPGAVIFVGRFDNPVGVGGLGPLPFLLQVGGFAALGVAALATGVSLVQRYAVADTAQRAQLRVYTTLAVFQAVAFAFFVVPFFVPDMSQELRNTIVALNLLIFAIDPLAVTLAIARYRLYEIDHVVERTFVYGALTAILAGLYAASLKVFQVLFTAATGEGSDAAIVLTTLVLVATFTPVKSRLDQMVARWTGQKAPAPVPPPEPAPAYDPRKDPEFEALVDERIRAMLAERYRGSRDPDTERSTQRSRR
jgi:hypothetical protein